MTNNWGSHNRQERRYSHPKVPDLLTHHHRHSLNPLFAQNEKEKTCHVSQRVFANTSAILLSTSWYSQQLGTNRFHREGIPMKAQWAIPLKRIEPKDRGRRWSHQSPKDPCHGWSYSLGREVNIHGTANGFRDTRWRKFKEQQTWRWFCQLQTWRSVGESLEDSFQSKGCVLPPDGPGNAISECIALNPRHSISHRLFIHQRRTSNERSQSRNLPTWILRSMNRMSVNNLAIPAHTNPAKLKHSLTPTYK